MVVIGDAAHAVGPESGLGAGLGLGDAHALAIAIERNPDDPDAACRDYEIWRRPAVDPYLAMGAAGARIARGGERPPEERWPPPGSTPPRLGGDHPVAARRLRRVQARVGRPQQPRPVVAGPELRDAPGDRPRPGDAERLLRDDPPQPLGQRAGALGGGAGSSHANSSPPMRAITSDARVAERIRAARVRSVRSPSSWPWRSLTSLKWSRSSTATLSGAPVRRACSISASSRASNARRFARPVSGSVSARRVSSSRAAALAIARPTRFPNFPMRASASCGRPPGRQLERPDGAPQHAADRHRGAATALPRSTCPAPCCPLDRRGVLARRPPLPADPPAEASSEVGSTAPVSKAHRIRRRPRPHQDRLVVVGEPGDAARLDAEQAGHLARDQVEDALRRPGLGHRGGDPAEGGLLAGQGARHRLLRRSSSSASRRMVTSLIVLTNAAPSGEATSRRARLTITKRRLPSART